ncbi:endonuclease NucS domain-containing protein [Paraburkholderia megapolitana]|uniref:endonuclease NucS domain-containing protein n=1 Tax=Paraburkholderia megapolitana TaxID=420953 RepID=UPI0038B71D25
MPIRTDLWKIGARPEQLKESLLQGEQFLEDMIVAAPEMLSGEWMLIGRQEYTGYSGRIDLLAIAPDASLVLIELKRDRTPRDVVAQALDYAAWVESLRSEEITAIYGRFSNGRSLAEDFQRRFGVPLDEEELNQGHQIVIVAASLDPSTERIVEYLAAQGIPINVLCFQVFSWGDGQLLSRSWLMDPITAQAAAVASKPEAATREPWNGEYYCSYGEGESRSWSDAVGLGFICGGGGAWYSRTLQLLNPGDRVWAKVPKRGFVGVGRVTGRAEPARSFTVAPDGGTKRSVLDAVKSGNYHREYLDDDELCEYFVPVKWIQTVPVAEAINEIGFFGNQNTVCKPTATKWRSTVDRLKERFANFDREN